jgi:FdhD protein
MHAEESRKITKYLNSKFSEHQDEIAVESLLKIFVNGEEKYNCLRTPGADINLAVGLCFTDGVINSYADIENIVAEDNLVRINLAQGGDSRLRGNDKERKDDVITSAQLFAMQENFFSQQKIFKITGATHAAGIYNFKGECLAFAEDVGRHNALDKCIGKVLIENNTDQIYLTMLSSRLSYEMVKKVCRLKTQILVGASAPTSLAIETAIANNITLIGFLRDQRFNSYANTVRIIP